MKLIHNTWSWMQDNFEYSSAWNLIRDLNLGLILSSFGAYLYASIQDAIHLFWTAITAIVVTVIGIIMPMVTRYALHKLKYKYKWIKDILEHDKKK